MTRGKRGQSTAIRREAREQQAEVADYQRKIVELTKALKATRQELASVHERNKRTVAELKAQVREATGPAVIVANHEARRLRDERDAAYRQIVALQKRWEHALRSVENHGRDEHGLKGTWFTPREEGGVELNKTWDAFMRATLGLGDLPPGSVTPSGFADVRKLVNRAEGVA